ncbi:hypothetical protein CYY_009940 [Polysphondylium violaceum]|uniref:Uncharacterized protein n=1 Tax=Polysphondylium violaceum TaxID=133409 RepID=A0A8J4PM60_9MYCE|nr:hypothetical protein CYY_009940 [Polysphondylium violaceum]
MVSVKGANKEETKDKLIQQFEQVLLKSEYSEPFNQLIDQLVDSIQNLVGDKLVDSLIKLVNAFNQNSKDENDKVYYILAAFLFVMNKELKVKDQTCLELAITLLDKSTTVNPKYMDALNLLVAVYDILSQDSSNSNKQMYFTSKKSEFTNYIKSLQNGEDVKLPKTSLSKYEKSLYEKEKGTEFFKKGDWKQAMYHYHCARNYVIGLFGLDPTNEANAKQLNIVLLNNLALCNTKLGKNERAVQLLDQVLKEEPNNVKALFRRGKAQTLLKCYGAAQDDLEAALRISPDDKEIARELKVLEIASKSYRANEAKVYAKMFEDS